MNTGIGLAFLVVIAVLEEATGFPDKLIDLEYKSQGNEEEYLDRQLPGCGTQRPCKIAGGKCQSLKEECIGELRTDGFYCKNSKRCGCCIPAGPEVDCPVKDGFYYQKTTHQCFKWYNSKMSKPIASLYCKNLSMELAHPIGPVELRQELVFRYGINNFEAECWMGAEYNGVNFVWADDASILPKTSPWWWEGVNNPEQKQCVTLMAWEMRMGANLVKPYFNNNCYLEQHPLCERKLK